MKVSHRVFVKQTATAATASVAGITLPAGAANLITDKELTQFKWSKAPRRFCGMSCGIEVAVKDNHMVVT